MRAVPKARSVTPQRRGPQPQQKTLFSEAVKGELDNVTRLIQSGAKINAKDEYKITALHYATRYNHTHVVKYLIANGADVKAKDKWAKTPLQVAESRGNQATVDALIEAEDHASITDEEGSPPLSAAAESGKLDTVPPPHQLTLFQNLQTLLKTHFEQSLTLDQNQETQIVNFYHQHKQQFWENTICAIQGNTIELETLSSHIQDYINTKLSHERMVLFNSIRKNPEGLEENTRHKEEITQMMINHPLLVFAIDEDKWTPLHLAAWRGNKDIAEYLIEARAEMNPTDDDGWTPLHLATQHGKGSVTTLLIDNGANVNAQITGGGWKGFSPLHLATYFGHKEVTSLLLKAGADMTIKNNQDETPLNLASQKKSMDIILLIAQTAEAKIQTQQVQIQELQARIKTRTSS